MEKSGPKLYLPRECRKVRRTHYFSTHYDELLKELGVSYAHIVGREVSHGILLQRGIEVLTERAVSILADASQRADEVSAIEDMLKRGLV